jgi:hypothetical protein
MELLWQNKATILNGACDCVAKMLEMQKVPEKEKKHGLARMYIVMLDKIAE